MSPARLAPPRDARTLGNDAGHIAVWQIAPGLYASKVEGRLTVPMADLIIEVGESQYTGGMVHGFHDWLAMTGYESRCRVALTNWVLGHRAHSRLSIAVRSKLVAMGVSVANLVLGNLIKICESPAELEADLEAARRGATAR